MVDRAREAAAILLRLGAVAINTKQLFTYTSGIQSPIYTDNRLLISYPEERLRITKLLVNAAEEAVGLANIDVVAGTATAGIPFAAWLADRLQRPMVYVRSSVKAHGMARQIEGRLSPGQRVAVVEDLITTGGSSLTTADVLVDNGALVPCCLAIFSYNLERARLAFEKRGIALVPLTTLDVLLEVAVAGNYIGPADAVTVARWAGGLEHG
ncbi:MAG: orotate phosphoribosyltransferase [Chloroflexota bacterium]